MDKLPPGQSSPAARLPRAAAPRCATEAARSMALREGSDRAETRGTGLEITFPYLFLPFLFRKGPAGNRKGDSLANGLVLQASGLERWSLHPTTYSQHTANTQSTQQLTSLHVCDKNRRRERTTELGTLIPALVLVLARVLALVLVVPLLQPSTSTSTSSRTSQYQH